MDTGIWREAQPHGIWLNCTAGTSPSRRKKRTVHTELRMRFVRIIIILTLICPSAGSIVTFNIKDANGEYCPFSEVGSELEAAGFAVRTGDIITLKMIFSSMCQQHFIVSSLCFCAGCFCNVGACQEFLSISAEDVEANYDTGRRCGGIDGVGDVINGRPTGTHLLFIRILNRKRPSSSK
jgi:hypothetical protein